MLNQLHDCSNTTAFAKVLKAGGSDCVSVCISGKAERFQTSVLLGNVDTDCFVTQDPFSPWFTGSDICTGLDELESAIRESFPHTKRYIFVGQSSGGYAALALSRRFKSNLSLAFAPQTFDDKALKSRRL